MGSLILDAKFKSSEFLEKEISGIVHLKEFMHKLRKNEKYVNEYTIQELLTKFHVLSEMYLSSYATVIDASK